MAIKSKFPYIRLVDHFQFIGLPELDICRRLKAIYQEAMQSRQSFLIFENIETLINYSSVDRIVRFSSHVLNTLKSLLSYRNTNKLIVVLTCQNEKFLTTFGLNKYLNQSFDLDSWTGDDGLDLPVDKLD